jgi:hypothetical protein
MEKVNFESININSQLKGVAKTAQNPMDNENGGLENGAKKGAERNGRGLM